MHRTTILLAPALAPLTGSGPLGCAVRDLARALGKAGWQVTIALGVDSTANTNSVGLARRLEPLKVDKWELTVHEGAIEGGAIKLLAFSNGESAATPESCLRAALQLESEVPEVVHLWPATQAGLGVVAALASSTVMHLDTAKISPEAAGADLILLPSRPAAQLARKDENSPLKDHQEKVHGLAPGCDDREWTPSRDRSLAERMEEPSTKTKAAAKAALQAELGLPESDLPLLGILAPITKLSRTAAEDLLKLPLQLVGINAGSNIEALANRAPKKAVCRRTSSEAQAQKLSHRIVAAADFILLPDTPSPVSRLFPCRYGTAIIARQQGEAAERLVNFDDRSNTGSAFLFQKDTELLAAVRQAIRAYECGEETRAALIQRCIQLDLSWNTVALRLNDMLLE